jgi:anti-sigma factor RsiW
VAGCRDVETWFAAYVDGEAPPAEQHSIDAHLRACLPCRERIAAERAVKELLMARREGLRPCASLQLRQRCDAHRPDATLPAGGRRSVGLRRWAPLAVAATLVFAIGAAFLSFGGVETLAAQLAIDHIKCFQVPPDVAHAPDADELGRQWAATRGWPLKVPASAPVEKLELLGIRRCISTEGLTAHMMYRWRGEPLSVFVLNRASSRVGTVQRVVEKLGQEAVIWSTRDRTYAVVARGRRSEIEQVAQYVRHTAE